ncbi:hypothetical protein TNCV_713361 [Trichonephila clavipes]|nr:hypothetical protein TNCV_713361 [Trichonephila clavipes]
MGLGTVNAFWLYGTVCRRMSSRRTSRASQLSTARSLGMSESLAPEAAQRIRNRTSLAGLDSLDSATSSGLGRAPRSAMQDPIQAPPGTTRQAGLCTS